MSPGAARRRASPDRLPAVADLEHLGGRARATPASIAARIVGRVLGARVVVGDDEDVGEPGRDLGHHRALARVAVAAGAEHDDHPAVGQRPQGPDRGGHGVGLVGVVDDDHEVLARVDPLEPARDAPAVGDAGGDRRRVEPGLAGRRHGGERVGDVEVARQRAAGRDAVARRAR